MEGGFTDGNVVNADGGRILIQEEIHIPEILGIRC